MSSHRSAVIVGCLTAALVAGPAWASPTPASSQLIAPGAHLTAAAVVDHTSVKMPRSLSPLRVGPGTVDGEISLSCKDGKPRASGTLYNSTDGIPYLSWETGGTLIFGDYMSKQSQLTFIDQQIPEGLEGISTTFTFSMEWAPVKNVAMVVPQCSPPTTPSPSPPETPTPTGSPTPISTPTATASDTPAAPQVVSGLPRKVRLGGASSLPTRTQQGASLLWKSQTGRICVIKKNKVKTLRRGVCRLSARAQAWQGFKAYKSTFTINVK